MEKKKVNTIIFFTVLFIVIFVDLVIVFSVLIPFLWGQATLQEIFLSLSEPQIGTRKGNYTIGMYIATVVVLEVLLIRKLKKNIKDTD